MTTQAWSHHFIDSLKYFLESKPVNFFSRNLSPENSWLKFLRGFRDLSVIEDFFGSRRKAGSQFIFRYCQNAQFPVMVPNAFPEFLVDLCRSRQFLDFEPEKCERRPNIA